MVHVADEIASIFAISMLFNLCKPIKGQSPRGRRYPVGRNRKPTLVKAAGQNQLQIRVPNANENHDDKPMPSVETSPIDDSIPKDDDTDNCMHKRIASEGNLQGSTNINTSNNLGLEIL